MPLWDGHFLIVGKCSEGKVRNVKKYFIHAPAWNDGPFQDLPGGAILRAAPHNSRLTAQAPLWRLRHGIIKMGNSMIPFSNLEPKDTAVYKLITTKPGEATAEK